MVEFQYRSEHSSLLGDVLRPVASVEVRSTRGHWFPAFMYIDSGADLTFVPNDFGKLLDMNLRLNPGYVAGITGRSLKVSVQDADIRIGKQVIRSKIAIASRNNVPYLLGRESIFRFFRISFEEYEQLVRFVPKDHVRPRLKGSPAEVDVREMRRRRFESLSG